MKTTDFTKKTNEQMNAMERQMKAERERREMETRAEGERKASITIAEGKKQAAILEAEAEKEAALRSMAEGEKIPFSKATVTEVAHADLTIEKYGKAITIEDVYEPYLLQLGFINRGPRGRIAMPLAYEHLNMPYHNK